MADKTSYAEILMARAAADKDKIEKAKKAAMRLDDDDDDESDEVAVEAEEEENVPEKSSTSHNDKKAANGKLISKEQLAEMEDDFKQSLKHRGLNNANIESLCIRFTKIAAKLTYEQAMALSDDIFAVTKSYFVDQKHRGDSRQADSEALATENKIIHAVFDEIQKATRTYLKSNILDIADKYEKIYNEITDRVIGQDYAAQVFVKACFNAEAYKTPDNKPQAVFLFAGPPGVGKTFLAESVAKMLDRPFKKFDMSAYAIEKSELNLIGSDPQFRDSSSGTLVSFVEENPDAIILFDEIEKAHSDVIKLFLQIMEGAVLDNAYTRENTKFNNTIIIFTTNAGKDIYDTRKGNLSSIPVEDIVKELQKITDSGSNVSKFPPEICSRFASNNIVMFNHLSVSDTANLVKHELDKAVDEIGKEAGIEISYDDRLALFLLLHFGGSDARVATSKARVFLKNEIYDMCRLLSKRRNKVKGIGKLRFEIDESKMSDNVAEIFTKQYDASIVICGDEKLKKELGFNNQGPYVRFCTDLNDLENLLDEDYDAFIVDPYYGMDSNDENVLGLDDYESVGIKIINRLFAANVEAPVYMAEYLRKINTSDRNTFYMKGVSDVLALDAGNAAEVIRETAANITLQKKCSKLIERHKILSFESAQTVKGVDRITISFYNVNISSAINTEDMGNIIDVNERPNVHFDDIIGAKDAKEEFKDFIEYLKNPKRYINSMGSTPCGILLYGPPGTGKTMLAKAVAGETDVTFISLTASELKSSAVGEGEKSIRDIFARARKYAPAIIFFDEIDGIAMKRGESSEYMASMLTILLTELDGFKQNKNAPVLFIAATNFGVDGNEGSIRGELDPGLLRRFDRRIFVNLPNREERKQFLELKFRSHKKHVYIENKISDNAINNAVQRLYGSSLAIAGKVIELAVRFANRKGRTVCDEDLDNAIDEYFYGEERKHNDEQMQRTAIHEAGHAYINYISGQKPSYVTIVSRGDFGGYMSFDADEESGTRTKEQMLGYIRSCLAGRIAEQELCGRVDSNNTGASQDLQMATSTALKMIAHYGMMEGHLFTMSIDRIMSTTLAADYVQMAENILSQQETACRRMVKEGADKIKALADELVLHKSLTQDDITEIIEGTKAAQ